MIVESLAKYMEDNGIGTRGLNIFIGELPFDKNNCVSLVYTPSPEPNKSLDVYEQVIDFRSRFKRTEIGYEKMLDILDLFHKGQNYSIDGFHVYFSNAMGMPDDNDRDVERRKLFSLSIRFIYRKDEDGEVS